MKPNGNTYKVTTLKTSAAHTAAITALVDATAGMILLTTPTDINTQHIQKLTAIPGNTTLSMGGGLQAVPASLLAGCFSGTAFSKLSLYIASVTSDQHGKNNIGGPNQWIDKVKISLCLLKIRLRVFVMSSRLLDG